jgi:histidyl-tRNA synthetase
VWRADRPQKGRYREFYQCDADVIGSKSLINEVELVQLFDDVFTALGLQVVVKINDRKVLSGIAEVSGQPEKVVDIVTAIDKLDKIGREKVEEEMRRKAFRMKRSRALHPCSIERYLERTTSEEAGEVVGILFNRATRT